MADISDNGLVIKKKLKILPADEQYINMYGLDELFKQLKSVTYQGFCYGWQSLPNISVTGTPPISASSRQINVMFLGTCCGPVFGNTPEYGCGIGAERNFGPSSPTEPSLLTNPAALGSGHVLCSLLKYTMDSPALIVRGVGTLDTQPDIANAPVASLVTGVDLKQDPVGAGLGAGVKERVQFAMEKHVLPELFKMLVASSSKFEPIEINLTGHSRGAIISFGMASCIHEIIEALTNGQYDIDNAKLSEVVGLTVFEVEIAIDLLKKQKNNIRLRVMALDPVEGAVRAIDTNSGVNFNVQLPGITKKLQWIQGGRSNIKCTYSVLPETVDEVEFYLADSDMRGYFCPTLVKCLNPNAKVSFHPIMGNHSAMIGMTGNLAENPAGHDFEAVKNSPFLQGLTIAVGDQMLINALRFIHHGDMAKAKIPSRSIIARYKNQPGSNVAKLLNVCVMNLENYTDLLYDAIERDIYQFYLSPTDPSQQKELQTLKEEVKRDGNTFLHGHVYKGYHNERRVCVRKPAITSTLDYRWRAYSDFFSDGSDLFAPPEIIVSEGYELALLKVNKILWDIKRAVAQYKQLNEDTAGICQNQAQGNGKTNLLAYISGKIDSINKDSLGETFPYGTQKKIGFAIFICCLENGIGITDIPSQKIQQYANEFIETNANEFIETHVKRIRDETTKPEANIHETMFQLKRLMYANKQLGVKTSQNLSGLREQLSGLVQLTMNAVLPDDKVLSMILQRKRNVIESHLQNVVQAWEQKQMVGKKAEAELKELEKEVKGKKQELLESISSHVFKERKFKISDDFKSLCKKLFEGIEIKNEKKIVEWIKGLDKSLAYVDREIISLAVEIAPEILGRAELHEAIKMFRQAIVGYKKRKALGYWFAPGENPDCGTFQRILDNVEVLLLNGNTEDARKQFEEALTKAMNSRGRIDLLHNSTFGLQMQKCFVENISWFLCHPWVLEQKIIFKYLKEYATEWREVIDLKTEVKSIAELQACDNDKLMSSEWLRSAKETQAHYEQIEDIQAIMVALQHSIDDKRADLTLRNTITGNGLLLGLVGNSKGKILSLRGDGGDINLLSDMIQNIESARLLSSFGPISSPGSDAVVIPKVEPEAPAVDEATKAKLVESVAVVVGTKVELPVIADSVVIPKIEHEAEVKPEAPVIDEAPKSEVVAAHVEEVIPPVVVPVLPPIMAPQFLTRVGLVPTNASIQLALQNATPEQRTIIVRAFTEARRNNRRFGS